ncbi:ribokinase [Brachybacterium endophyticum]|uniref:Ribokinase n=1 Tax=Brachybacterium endophyticum TaxID=2182385 RepID=A0A2U2RI03_9MICO|nr:ribokinase [Brachybacterium endophyticum]PWH05509.1 ribokinase [Brachybacterium endophyticum]
MNDSVRPAAGPTDLPSESGASAPIVVVGSINADLSTRVSRHPRPGETLHGTGGQVRPGGKGANQAAAAALMGGRVAMVGAVGTDAMASDALSVLEGSGADLTAVRRVDGPTGLAVVTVSEDGENTIVVVPGANGAMDADAVGACSEVIASARVVVLQGEIPREGIEAAARLATGRVILNPAPVLELDAEVLCSADPLVVNEHEAALVLAQLTAGPGSVDGLSPADLARALHEAGIRTLVLTLGAAGALVGTPTADGWDLQEAPGLSVDAVDTTGAGDAFVGALAVRLSEDAALVDAARFATRVAAASVTRDGAQSSYPREGEGLPGNG